MKHSALKKFMAKNDMPKIKDGEDEEEQEMQDSRKMEDDDEDEEEPRSFKKNRKKNPFEKG